MMKLVTDDRVLQLNKSSRIDGSYYEERQRRSKNRKDQWWMIRFTCSKGCIECRGNQWWV